MTKQEIQPKVYSVVAILGERGSTRIDLGTYGLFDAREVVIFPGERAVIRGLWEGPDGEARAAEVDLRLVEFKGSYIRPSRLEHVLNGFWEDWDLEPLEKGGENLAQD